MDFEYSAKSMELQAKLIAFMERNIYPVEHEYGNFVYTNPWEVFPKMEMLKSLAKKEGLWNLFLPKEYGDLSQGLTNLEYAPLAEIMGKVLWSSTVFNCAAPDTGNMEVLAKYGSEQQKEKWLMPLMEGKIRSSFLMTEPEVASSDATNIQTSIVEDGDEFVINGRKWWSSGAMHPQNELFIVMGKTDPQASRHTQQSMILVPKKSEGVTIVRPLRVFGNLDSPEGHCDIILKNVRVPKENLILGTGRGFEIAQGRLGPGRIHHCMRLIGVAQRALDLMCKRVSERMTFGKRVADYSSIRQEVALSSCEIEQARLLTLSAADKIDKKGAKESKDLIAMIKVVCPRMACKVIDRSIQAHGGLGVSEDTPLAGFWTYARSIRLADGPDEVHMYQLGKHVIKSVLV